MAYLKKWGWKRNSPLPKRIKIRGLPTFQIFKTFKRKCGKTFHDLRKEEFLKCEIVSKNQKGLINPTISKYKRHHPYPKLRDTWQREDTCNMFNEGFVTRYIKNSYKSIGKKNKGYVLAIHKWWNVSSK